MGKPVPPLEMDSPGDIRVPPLPFRTSQLR